jgi:hypothetical protein
MADRDVVSMLDKMRLRLLAGDTDAGGWLAEAIAHGWFRAQGAKKNIIFHALVSTNLTLRFKLDQPDLTLIYKVGHIRHDAFHLKRINPENSQYLRG